MESPIEPPDLSTDRPFKRSLSACGLVAAVIAVVTLVMSSHSSDPAFPAFEIAYPSAEVDPGPSRSELRCQFFEQEVQPRIDQTDQLNRAAAARCVNQLSQLMNRYRSGVDPFVEDLTSISTRLGILRRMPGGWWSEDDRVESYVQSKFEKHLFSEVTLARDVGRILDAFRMEVDANQKRMLIEIRASLNTADLPEITLEDYDGFLASVASQLRGYASRQGTSSVQNALTVLILSEAGSYAAITLASGLIARFGAMAATTAAAAGGATAGASAAGAGSGSLGGPVGTVVGLGVGLVIGLVIDWWMTEEFEAEMRSKMKDYIDKLEHCILHGSNPSKNALSEQSQASSSEVNHSGIGDSLPIVCERLREAYQTRFRQQIVDLEPAS